MHTYDAHGLPYFTSSSDIMQFGEDCYTVVSYAPYILLQIYAITNLATFGVTIFDFFHLWPQPITHKSASRTVVGGSAMEISAFRGQPGEIAITK